jgi:hypothetical protein
MRPYCFLPLLLAIVTTLPLRASAQCQDWKPGLMVEGDEGVGANETVRALISWDPDGDGPLLARLVAAGSFDSIGGVAVDGIAYLDPATGRWQPFGAPIGYPRVDALAVFNNRLIASNDQIRADGASGAKVWSGSSWVPMGFNGCFSGFVNMFPGRIATFAASNGLLVGAGSFGAWDEAGPQNCAGQGGRALGVWDGDGTWSEDFGPTSGSVKAMAQYGARLFVGGSGFSWPGDLTIGGHSLAAWNGTSWSSAGIEANNMVEALQPWNGGLAACGAFTEIGGVPANRVAFYDGASWQDLGSGVTALANSMTVYKGELIVSGGFLTAGGEDVNYIARWNGASWRPLGQGLGGSAFAMTVHNGELVVGGGFLAAGGQTVNRIARWDGTRWAGFGGGTVSTVNAITAFGSRLVVAGSFQQSTRTAQPAFNVVSWDGSGLSAFGSGIDGIVRSLESFKYPGINGAFELIAGGTFFNAGGVPAGFIARWVESPLGGSPPAWEPMGAGFSGTVQAIERHAGATYAGGIFSSSGGATVLRIARWNEASDVWEPMGGGMNTGAVYALKSFGGQLYAGGSFTSAGGAPTGGLARWNGSAWNSVGGAFAGTVLALEVHDGRLIIGGTFSGFPGSPNIVAWDGASFSSLGTGGTNSAVNALYSDGTRLHVGGAFTSAGGLPVSRLATWDGAWGEVPGGPSAPVEALFGFRGELNVGGVFDVVGSGALVSPGWARFTATGLPWFATNPASRTVDFHADASFNAEPAAGYEDATLRWHRDGVPLEDGMTIGGSTIAGATTKSLLVERATPLDAGVYRLDATHPCGTVQSLGATLTVNPTVGVDGATPGVTRFESIGPNPARGPARVVFALARPGSVRLTVHDVSGRLVRRLDLGSLAAGRHRALWDGCGEGGGRMPAGLYLVRLAVDGRPAGTRRMTMLR